MRAAEPGAPRPTGSTGSTGSDGGPPTLLPTSLQAPGTPWRWGACLVGLAVAFGPEVLLYAAAAGIDVPARSPEAATVASAVLLAVSSLVVYSWHIFAAWLCSLRLPGNRLSAWGFRRPSPAFFWTVPVALVGVYVLNVLYSVVVESRQQDIIGEFPRSTAGIALFVIVAVVMAPFFEEVFFRGFLFRGLAASWGWVAGAVASSAVFGLAHLQLDIFVPLLVLGLALAWVYKRTGSLWTSITLHALFNTISVLLWALA